SSVQIDSAKKKGTIDRHTIQVEYADRVYDHTAPTLELAPNFSQSIAKKGSSQTDTSDRILSTQNISPPAKQKSSHDSSFNAYPRPLPAPPAASTPSSRNKHLSFILDLTCCASSDAYVSVSPARSSVVYARQVVSVCQSATSSMLPVWVLVSA
ncbi:hypothetical protein EDB19DRAFT_1363003, partial [Suillus lakei]